MTSTELTLDKPTTATIFITKDLQNGDAIADVDFIEGVEVEHDQAAYIPVEVARHLRDLDEGSIISIECEAQIVPNRNELRNGKTPWLVVYVNRKSAEVVDDD